MAQRLYLSTAQVQRYIDRALSAHTNARGGWYLGAMSRAQEKGEPMQCKVVC